MTATCDLNALINAIIPGCLPQSLYYVRKSLSYCDVNDVETHVYCSKCGSYLSHANGTNDMVTCSEPESVVSCSDMVKMVVHFLYFHLNHN